MLAKGTRFLYGKDADEYQGTIDTLRKITKEHGFQEVIVSSLASQDIFVEKAGKEILEQMYAFKDKGERDICLIPEVTAVIQAWYKIKHKELKKPAKVFYVNRCYRYENPQSGRYREFTQFGVEVLGGKSDPYTTGEALKQLLVSLLDGIGLNGLYVIDDSVKRGLSYYVEEGFEARSEHLGAQKQIAGGGRYDCGIGFGIGVERVILAKQQTQESINSIALKVF
jgi:histidyl-tRNA synthetase